MSFEGELAQTCKQTMLERPPVEAPSTHSAADYLHSQA
jgi:hypothetical protein